MQTTDKPVPLTVTGTQYCPRCFANTSFVNPQPAGDVPRQHPCAVAAMCAVRQASLARARRVEQTWRGEITPERIAADWDDAIDLDKAATDRRIAIDAVLARKAAEAAATVETGK